MSLLEHALRRFASRVAKCIADFPMRDIGTYRAFIEGMSTPMANGRFSLESQHQPPPHPRRSRPYHPFLGGVNLGRWFGVNLVAHWSLIAILVLVLINLCAGTLPTLHPDWSFFEHIAVGCSAAGLLILSIVAHELAHAITARLLGIPVLRISLFMFGGMSLLDREPTHPRDELLIALAGPLVSLLIGFGTLLAGMVWVDAGINLPEIATLETYFRVAGPVGTLLLWLGPINLMLGIFNLVPGFPLDGGRVFRAIVWWTTGDFSTAMRWAAASGQVAGGILIAAGAMMSLGIEVPILGVGIVPGIWSMLIGWFLVNAARSSYQRIIVHQGPLPPRSRYTIRG